MIINLLRFAQIEYIGEGTLVLLQDVQGGNLATIATIPLPSVASSRLTRFTLPGNARASRLVARFTNANGATLSVESAAVYAKALGMGPTAWRWVAIPIPPTPQEWTRIQIQIPKTPDDWQRIQIQIPKTPDDWIEIPLKRQVDQSWRWIDVPGGEANNP